MREPANANAAPVDRVPARNQVLREPAIANAAPDDRLPARVQVMREPANANAAQVVPARVQVPALQQRAARGPPETDEMIDRSTW